MNTHEISSILHNDKLTKHIFKGVFAADQVPNLDGKMYEAYVINTDELGLPGKHWVSVFIDNFQLEYFDSYGLSPLGKFDYFLNDKSYKFNAEQLQSILTTVCGHYAIYFLLKRCKNISMQEIVNEFSDDYLKNDGNVFFTINKRYDLPILPVRSRKICSDGQTCQPYRKQ